MAIYTPELGTAICEDIASSDKSLKEIAAKYEISRPLILKWAATDPDFRDRYARAKEIQIEAMAEDILEIADDARNDWMDKRFGETEVRVPDPEVLQRSRLRVDTRKWLMSKLAPKKYGERTAVVGEDGGPLKFVLEHIGSPKD